MENLEVGSPKRSITFRQLGTKAVFESFLSPLDGLESFNITLDQNGAYIDWSFATRATETPRPDALTQKITAAMNMNTLR